MAPAEINADARIWQCVWFPFNPRPWISVIHPRCQGRSYALEEPSVTVAPGPRLFTLSVWPDRVADYVPGGNFGSSVSLSFWQWLFAWEGRLQHHDVVGAKRQITNEAEVRFSNRLDDNNEPFWGSVPMLSINFEEILSYACGHYKKENRSWGVP